MQQKLNERAWAGQLISWIQEAIREGRTVFQDATNDAGIKLESGKTKFPDILLFSDKISGIIFNGWELKFPDTAVDDRELLTNALEKAERIASDSFVSWNGAEAIIWKIQNNNYTIGGLTRIKEYPKEQTINNRSDLSDPNKYRDNEPQLKNRLNEILHDLEQYLQNGELKQAINISGSLVNAIKSASEIILPQFKDEIIRLKGVDVSFRTEFKQWKIYESSTLSILSSSSRKPITFIEEDVLAKFTFYNLIGRIIFYLTLSENLPRDLEKLELKTIKNLKSTLEHYFETASKIDYQAVFTPYFTDKINFNPIVNDTLLALLNKIIAFDFKILPSDVIGTILENLVPKDEKQKLGQYFTPSILANFVSFPAIQTANDTIFDPTSGTGTFLNSSYEILKYYGNTNHTKLLNRIWGNDISHFPSILSVINLYKQKLTQTDNFPRVTRDDYFNLEPGKLVVFPDSKDIKKHVEQPIPIFDAIVSNFPFIQQEDIPNKVLKAFFEKKFEKTQQAFLRDTSFHIDKHSDYFTYCIYNSIGFLKTGGFLSAITSNAWLGKEYGFQFKKFLLDNFHIKYVIRSNAEHWFTDSKVSTIFTVLEKGQSNEPTRFVTINFKLHEKFDGDNINSQLKNIEDFYTDIDNCSNPKNSGWKEDATFQKLFHKIDGTISISLISKEQLLNSITEKENWSIFFISGELFQKFDKHLVKLYPEKIDVFRGQRTGWNNMFIIPSMEIEKTRIEKRFLIPYVKSPTELATLEFQGNYEMFLFVCNLPLLELKTNFPGAYDWIQRFKSGKNKNGKKTIQEACKDHKPYWYSLQPKQANIVTAINPFERLFFSYSVYPFTIDQRLVAIKINDAKQIELYSALLNSIITYLTIEIRGTSRNLGALDLNANYFKTLKVLNPDNLTDIDKKEIITTFRQLKRRPIETIFEEVRKKDRIEFDKAILKAYGYDISILNQLYTVLIETIRNRTEMKNR